MAFCLRAKCYIGLDQATINLHTGSTMFVLGQVQLSQNNVVVLLHLK
jgi:hypothetical protein